MRKNRRDPESREHDAVWANPGGFTRAARRSAGYRKSVSLIGPEHEGLVVKVEETPFPRTVRRNILRATGDRAKRRTRRWRARILIALRPYGIDPAW